MSRERWQQRLLESIFIFYTDELRAVWRAMKNSESIQIDLFASFFVLPDSREASFYENIEVYRSKSYANAILHEIGLPDIPGFEVLRDTPLNHEGMLVYLQAADRLDEILNSLPDEQIAIAYRTLEINIEEQNQSSREINGETRDTFAFFNEFEYRTDGDYWAGMSFWLLEECVALSLGKDPRHVNSESLNLPSLRKFYSPFRQIYKSRLEFLKRAQLAGKIKEPIERREFILWAHNQGWELPEMLLRAMTRPGQRSVGSKQEQPATADVPANLNPSPKMIYRLLLGMAIARFEHRTDRNSSATAAIEADLRDLQARDDIGSKSLGEITVSNDTIRKALEAAANYLDAGWSEPIRWSGVRRTR